MNRQIEFRGKCIHNNEWVYGYLYIHEPPLTICEPQDESKRKYYIIQTGFADWNLDRPKVWHEVDPKTIGLFTGLFDKHNKKIFEDDMLKDKYNNIGYCYWESSNWTFLDTGGCVDNGERWEVVGNKVDGVNN